MKVERLVFNAFQENTYLVFDDTGECVIIDPGCSDPAEEEELDRFISKSKLKPVAHLYTHCHIDHILGITHVYSKYGLRPLMHHESLKILRSAGDHGRVFGIELGEIIEPETYLNEGDQVKFGNSALEVLYTPGHVDGHVCFVSRAAKFAIVGDVLFRESIGRTDLPTGDFDALVTNIRNKLYTLPPEFIAYPGHGPHTTIGHERHNNPFVRG
ncbi:MAG: MBL fold metallo-hydrolase [Bacteroidales bacterium]|nr:MBL fold metallo-hydrolase [Bacteroidales bacterium]